VESKESKNTSPTEWLSIGSGAVLKHMNTSMTEHSMNKHDSQLIGQDYYNKCILGYSRKDLRSTACSRAYSSNRISSNLGLVS
jgi:hypothetical protein